MSTLNENTKLGISHRQIKNHEKRPMRINFLLRLLLNPSPHCQLPALRTDHKVIDQ